MFRSLNLVWLVWAVGGGFFLTNFILSSYITILIRPMFGKPLETAEVKPPFYHNFLQLSSIVEDLCRLVYYDIF